MTSLNTGPLTHCYKSTEFKETQTEGVVDTYNFRFKWRLNFSVHELQPVDVSKENMIFDVLLSFLSTTQALGRMLGQKLNKQHGITQVSATPTTFVL